MTKLNILINSNVKLTDFLIREIKFDWSPNLGGVWQSTLKYLKQ